MSVEEYWSHFFKPEVRKQGADYAADGIVVLSQSADTQIQAFVRKTPPLRVSFRADSIASETFTADCTCSSSGKGQLCKHIWATLLVVEKSYPDFLDSKRDIEKVSGALAATAGKTARPESPERAASAAAFKEKQADYRKAQYQKQKQRVKDQKQAKKNAARGVEPSTYPDEIQEAITWFSENGFQFEYPADAEEVGKAKKILSRIFHPDKGGTHEEMLILNRHAEALTQS